MALGGRDARVPSDGEGLWEMKIGRTNHTFCVSRRACRTRVPAGCQKLNHEKSYELLPRAAADSCRVRDAPPRYPEHI